MSSMIGIRREDKNPWEGRAPLTPEHVRELRERYSLEVVMQPSTIRAFPDQVYKDAGAAIDEDMSSCPVVFGIKEIPPDSFEPGKTYIFFSHTIKGQSYNMPILRRLLEQKCSLIDYEKVEDDEGRRLIFFGKFAGLAGMIDSLWSLGQRLAWEGIENPFYGIRQALHYKSLEDVTREISQIGDAIRSEGLPPDLRPLICGFTGYGHVSTGAQEIFDLLPVETITPEEVALLAGRKDRSGRVVYKVVFKEEHLVEPVEAGQPFELQDYYDHPEKYRSIFGAYVPHLTMIMNCIYWDQRYPRFVTKRILRDLFGGDEKPRLRVIGDITCDVEGAMECTARATDPGNPVFVYDPIEETTKDGYAGRGPVVLAVDNLPCELAGESTAYFSHALKDFIPQIAKADYSGSFEECDLPSSFKRGMIVYKGELTPDYRYLQKYL